MIEQQVREIILDTETTGLYAKNGDRIIEIGCIELVNKVRTGRHFHKYINPECDIAEAATKVHGITRDQLMDKPLFKDIVKEMLDFFGDDGVLVIHNAGFDMSFINMELGLCGIAPFNSERVIDTLNMARRKFPGSPASLDALCKRFKISLDTRDKHGALIDAELLASVYINLMGGGQAAMNLFEESVAESSAVKKANQIRDHRKFNIVESDLKSHEEFIATIKNPLWSA